MGQGVILRPLSAGDRSFVFGPVHMRFAMDGRHWDVFPSGNFGSPCHYHSTNMLYLLFIVILQNNVLLERKAGEAWDFLIIKPTKYTNF
jgi:hypothetical protein